MTQRIAIVDDDATLRAVVHDLLSDEGYEPHGMAPTLAVALLPRLRMLQPDVILLDLHLQGQGSGWRILDRIRADPVLATMPVVIWSADAVQLRARAPSLEAPRCYALDKPFDLDLLLQTLERALSGPA
ncbi:MAG TPA: response regulator [Chloroflexota bacterium]